MNLRDKIKRIVQITIENYDFESIIEECINENNIKFLIEDKIESKIDEIDICPIISDTIEEIVDEVLDFEIDFIELISEKI